MKKNQEKHVCCICGKEFTGWGNNPIGALDKDGKMVDFKDEVCCDECNARYVLTARMFQMKLINEFRPVPEKR